MSGVIPRDAHAVNVPGGAIDIAVLMDAQHIGALIIVGFYTACELGITRPSGAICLALLFWGDHVPMVDVRLNLRKKPLSRLEPLFRYYIRYERDARVFKMLVYALIGVNTFFTVIRCVWSYRAIVSNFGNYQVVGRASWLLFLEWPLTSLAALLTQCFYAFRVYRLLGSLAISAVICILGSVGFAFAIVMFVLRARVGTAYYQAEAVIHIAWTLSTSQACSAAADILIFATMLRGLHRISQLPIVSWRHRQIVRLLFLTFDTQIVTTALAIAVVVLYQLRCALHRRPRTVNAQQPRLFAFSVFLSLLSRKPGPISPHHFEGAESLDRGTAMKPWLSRLPKKQPLTTKEKSEMAERAGPVTMLDFLASAESTIQREESEGYMSSSEAIEPGRALDPEPESGINCGSDRDEITNVPCATINADREVAYRKFFEWLPDTRSWLKPVPRLSAKRKERAYMLDRPKNPQRQYGIVSLSAESSDTSPSLLLCFDNARYLFNAGEGTTRAFVGKGVGFSKLGTIFTTRADTKSAIGLPGLLCSLSESQGDVSTVSDFDIIGPPKLSHMIATARYFSGKAMTEVRVHETLPEAPGPSKKPIYEDFCVRVFDFAVRSAPAAHPTTKKSKRKRSSSPASFPNGSSGDNPAAYKGAEAKNWLREVITGMFHGPEYRYTGKGRSPSNEGRSLPRLDPAEDDISTSYLVIGPEQRGRFKPEIAKALGVPAGPLFGILSRGESVTLPDGRIVESDSCKEQDGAPNAFFLIDCPDEHAFTELRSLNVNETARANNASIRIVYHLLGPAVADMPTYWQWAQSLGDAEHVISAPDLVPDQIALGRPFLRTLRLAKLAPEWYPVPYYVVHSNRALSSVEGLPSQSSLWTGDRRWDLGKTASFAFTSTPRHFDVQLNTPEAENMITSMASHGNSPREAQLRKAWDAAWTTYTDLIKQATAAISVEAEARADSSRHAVDDIVVTALGTGSASPSAYRNVSGTLLQMPEKGYLLLDCGENTLGQLRRLYGPERSAEILRSLRIICISHMHGDHHAGLGSLLRTRARLPDAAPLTLICPPMVWAGLCDHDVLEGLGLDNVTFVRAGWVEREDAPAETLKSLDLAAIKAVEVDHRGGRCFGYVIDGLASWRIAYSGDTRPCQALVKAGMNADLLIHEATLDDEHTAMAHLKGHSTAGQAVGIAQAMGAKRLLLTHFSQRYPKSTTISPELLAQQGLDLVLASDGMQMRIGDAWMGKHYLEPIRAISLDLEGMLKSETDPTTVD